MPVAGTAAAVASRTEHAEPLSEERPESTGRVLRLAGDPERSDVVERERSSRPTPSEVRPLRPPVLASESLREDLEPTEPGRLAMRWGGTATALFGAAAALGLGEISAVVLVLAAIFLGIAALCAIPIGYAARAISVLVGSVAGLAIDTAARVLDGGPPEAPILAAGTAVLSGGLLFRARYRASRVARVAIALGLAVVTSWVLLTLDFENLHELEGAWQSWLPVAVRVTLVPLLLLSLLAFMDASSTGGARVWAVLLVVWYAFHVGVQLAVGLASARNVVTFAGIRGAAAATTIAAPLLLALAATALAQVLAVIAGGTADRRMRERISGETSA